MRMWMVDPRLMCRKHLLGEHVELHMIAGTIRRGRSLVGYADRGLIQAGMLQARHAELVDEMTRRGYRHRSPLPDDVEVREGEVDSDSSREDLMRRCVDCRQISEGEG